MTPTDLVVRLRELAQRYAHLDAQEFVPRLLAEALRIVAEDLKIRGNATTSLDAAEYLKEAYRDYREAAAVLAGKETEG